MIDGEIEKIREIEVKGIEREREKVKGRGIKRERTWEKIERKRRFNFF